MNGPIAQVVALTLHGNAALFETSAKDFLGRNSTAQFCQSIEFVREESILFGFGRKRRVTSPSFELWIEDLIVRKATRIGVRWFSGKPSGMPDRMLAAFVGGGGTWTLQVKLSNGVYEQWVAQWAVEESRRNVDKKIWSVCYERAYAGRESLPVADLMSAQTELSDALSEIHAFATRLDLKPFTQMFAKALAAINNEKGSDAYHYDLFPVNSGSPLAFAVLQAAQHAWVFGGMGSWNDMGFDGADGKEYERVSERLYKALIQVIPAAAESRP